MAHCEPGTGQVQFAIGPGWDAENGIRLHLGVTPHARGGLVEQIPEGTLEYGYPTRAWRFGRAAKIP